MKKLLLPFFWLTACFFLLTSSVQAQNPPKREFRGAWIQCVNGQYLGKTPDQLREMLSSQLDRLQQCGINAIVFQVRAECDALYKSQYEPWSRYLTGQQGVAPSDGWDPLSWMVDQCHRRGMELHAWINPYRAKTKFTSELAPTHYVLRHPDRVFEYDGLQIVNPAIPENRLYTCMVVEDILQHYDVDGIHMDDYFYPYPVAGVNIPDEAFYQADPRGFSSIEDWRRDNVNQLILDLHRLIREVKPWVKFGISPFGIYRNNTEMVNAKRGSATKGTQNYDDLYADIVLWQQEGWVDYLVPQVYWNIGNRAADYEILCNWWNDFCHQRPLFIGQDVERTVKGTDPQNPQKHQMDAKYEIQRSLKHVQGSCQWYAAAVCNNPGDYADRLRTYYHRYPALQPLMTFIDKKAPKQPRNPRLEQSGQGTVLRWSAPKAKREMDRAVQYVVYDFRPGEKVNLEDASHILAITTSPEILLNGAFADHLLLITALDRLHNESKPIRIRF